MSAGGHFCVTVRFLQPTFHGRAEGGRGEWPPSPLRVFQALVATAARLQPGGLDAPTLDGFRWLERCPAPIILAPRARETTGMRLSVPNNAMDIVARAWARGNETEKGDADPRTHRTMKTVRPYWLRGDRLTYVWCSSGQPLDGGAADRMIRAARHLSCIGWGIDQVVGDASTEDAQIASLKEEEWHPSAGAAGTGLRTPISGTFEDLEDHHRAFLNRIGPDRFSAPPPVSVYGRFQYRRASDPAARPIAAFALLRPDGEAFRAFDAARKALTVAGMVRRATKEAAIAAGWPEEKIRGFVLGHGDNGGRAPAHVGPGRFAYLPLPSVEWRGEGKRVVGSVRRVVLTSLAWNREEEVIWAGRAMSGRDLFDEDTGEVVSGLVLLPDGDKATLPYVGAATTWSSVTPVVLPGHDDPEHLRHKVDRCTEPGQRKRYLERLTSRIDGLIRKALKQFGLPDRMAQDAQIEWGKIGFLPGVGHADRYGVPNHLRKYPRYHVRIGFRDSAGQGIRMPGPLCIGGGRYYGIGLCVGDE